MYTYDDTVHDVRYDHLCDSFWGESDDDSAIDLYRWDTLDERSCDNLPTKAGNGTGPAFFVLQSGGKKE